MSKLAPHVHERPKKEDENKENGEHRRTRAPKVVSRL